MERKQGGAVNKGLAALLIILLAGAAVTAALFVNRGEDAGEEADAFLKDMPLVELESRGRAVERDGVITVKDVVFVPRQGKDETRVTAGTIQVVRALGGESLLAESMTLSDVKVDADGAEWSIGEFTLKRPRDIRMSRDELGKALEDDPEGLLAYLVKHVAFEGMVISDVQGKADDLEWRLERLDLNGLGQTRLEDFSFEGLSIQAENEFTLTFEGFALRGLDFSRLFDADGRLVSDDPEELFNRLVMEFAELRDMRMVVKTYVHLEMDRFTLDGVEFVHGVPVSSQLTMDGLRINSPWFKTQPFFKDIPELDIHLSMASSYDPETRQMHLKQYTLGERHLFRADFAVTGEDVDLQDVDPSNYPYEFLMEMPVSFFQLRFEEKSILRRLIEMEMRDQDKTWDQVVDEIVEDLEIDPMFMDGGSEAGKIVDAIAEFIRKPEGVITLTMKPNPPIGFNEGDRMMDEEKTSEFIKRLNISIVREQ